MTFQNSNDLRGVGYLYSDFADCINDMKSCTMFALAGGAISLKSVR